jgi:hypothetical protein
MNGNIVLNFAPLLLNIPYQQSKLITAINQIEKDGEIFFRVSFNVEYESAGTLELEIKNKEEYKNGESPIWKSTDNEMHNNLINIIGRQIEIFFKRLV